MPVQRQSTALVCCQMNYLQWEMLRHTEHQQTKCPVYCYTAHRLTCPTCPTCCHATDCNATAIILKYTECWSHFTQIADPWHIIFINCNWVITRWQWLYYMYTNMERRRKKKKVTRKYKSGGLHERHVVATWKLGNHLSILL